MSIELFSVPGEPETHIQKLAIVANGTTIRYAVVVSGELRRIDFMGRETWESAIRSGRIIPFPEKASEK